MSSYCFPGLPEVCGKLDIGFPVVEVLVPAVLTVVVAWLTIRVSIQQARNETEKALEASKVASLWDGIVDIGADANDRVARRDWQNDKRSSAAIAAFIRIRQSGRPCAPQMAAWAEAYSDYAAATAIANRYAPDLARQIVASMNGLNDPSRIITSALAKWLGEPEHFATTVDAEIETFRNNTLALKKQVRAVIQQNPSVLLGSPEPATAPVRNARPLMETTRARRIERILHRRQSK